MSLLRLILLLAAFAPAVAFGQSAGRVSGRILDATTRQGLVGASVWLEPLMVGDASDSEGFFELGDIPPGTYQLHVRFIGYRPVIRPDIVVEPNRTVATEIVLTASVLQSDEVVVQADYFDREYTEPTGVAVFGAESIRRGAGTAGDVQRLLAGLPSVSRMDDMRNALAVRGGSPLENRFLVDGIPIPNLNHFPTQGASGGAIGILNPELIGEVTFHPAAFGAAYGDRLSSVVEIGLRNPAPRGFQIDFSMAGAGLTAERSSETLGVLFAARRSWVDLLVKTFLAEQADATPTYSDAVSLLSFRPGKADRIQAMVLVGIDRSSIDQDAAVKNHENQFGDADFDMVTTGVSWLRTGSSRSYHETVVSRSENRHRFDFRSTASGAPFMRNDSKESSLFIGHTRTVAFSPGVSLAAAVSGEHERARFDADSGDRSLHRSRLAAFVESHLKPSPLLQFRPGIRLERYESSLMVLPRLAIRANVSPSVGIRLAAGRYAQALPLALFVDEASALSAPVPTARHIVAGIDWRAAASTLVTVDLYRKSYRGFPQDPSRPNLFAIDELYDSGLSLPLWPEYGALAFEGRARSMGFELAVRKPLARRLYGLASVSVSSAEYQAADGMWHRRLFDNRYVVTLDGGYKLSDRHQVAARWTMAGGRPYTPFDEDASSAAGLGVPDPGRIQSAEIPDYMTLNLRYDIRFQARGAWIVGYASIWNVTGRRNVSGYYWDEVDGTVRERLQWGMLPLLGLEVLL